MNSGDCRNPITIQGMWDFLQQKREDKCERGSVVLNSLTVSRFS